MYELPKFVQRKMFPGEAQSLSFQLVQCFQLVLDLFMLSRKRYSRWSLKGLNHVSLPTVRPWLSSLQIFLTPCPHVRRLFFFKAFQPLLVIYLHTVVLETLILLKVEFFLPFCLVEFLRTRHILTAFSITFVTYLQNNGHHLLGLSSKVFTFDHLFTYIVQTSLTVYQFL